MALRHWGFIYVAAGADPGGERTVIDTGECTTVLVGVPDPADGLQVARSLAGEGVQLIELCGAFGAVHAGAIIEAVGSAVPVGMVAYGPEAVDQLHAIFS